MAAALASNISNCDPQTLLLLSQQLADLANSQLSGGAPQFAPQFAPQSNALAIPGSNFVDTGFPPGPYSGSFDREMGKFGFIKQDSGEDDMFVLPGACKAFNEVWPPKGTRVTYDCVPDPKSGKLKAENMQPEGGFFSQPTVEAISCTHSGAFDRERGNYGFIKQDNGEEDMFVLPGACKSFGERFPPKGTRLVYNTELDAKSGKWKASDVQLEGGMLGGMSSGAMALVQSALGASGKGGFSGGGGGYQQPVAAPPRQQVPGQIYTGKFDRERGSFGFIKQDNGLEDMFVLPSCCEAFGGFFPPIGTRVQFSVYFDTRNGKPRAENVSPETGSQGQAFPLEQTNGFNFSAVQQPQPQPQANYPPGNSFSGKFDRERGTYGFIKQDSGMDDMFALPGACEAYGGVFPPIGTRVTYNVTYDAKSGKPVAERVRPESGEVAAAIEWAAGDSSSRFMPYA